MANDEYRTPQQEARDAGLASALSASKRGGPSMDWVCVCGHDSDWHNVGPNKPGGPCKACAAQESPSDGLVDLVGALRKAVDAARARRLGEHSSNPREDR